MTPTRGTRWQPLRISAEAYTGLPVYQTTPRGERRVNVDQDHFGDLWDYIADEGRIPNRRLVFEVHDAADGYSKSVFSNIAYGEQEGIEARHLLDWMAKAGYETDVVQVLQDKSDPDVPHGKVIAPDYVVVHIVE